MGRGYAACIAAGCRLNYRHVYCSLFSFPRESNRARQWAIAAGREDLLEPVEQLFKKKLCDKHFEHRMFKNNRRSRLIDTAFPTIFPLLEGSSSVNGSSGAGLDENQHIELPEEDILIKVEQDEYEDFPEYIDTVVNIDPYAEGKKRPLENEQEEIIPAKVVKVENDEDDVFTEFMDVKKSSSMEDGKSSPEIQQEDIVKVEEHINENASDPANPVINMSQFVTLNPDSLGVTDAATTPNLSANNPLGGGLFFLVAPPPISSPGNPGLTGNQVVGTIQVPHVSGTNSYQPSQLKPPITSSKATQVSKSLVAQDPKIKELKYELKLLKEKNNRLKKKVEDHPKDPDSILDTVSFEQYKRLTFKFFPSKELASSINSILSQLLKKSKGRRFSPEFKNYCLSLYFIGPKYYVKELVPNLGLPGIRTLLRFIQHIKFPTGINDIVFDGLQKKIVNFPDVDKLCIISVNEMSIKANLFYAFDSDKIIGFHDCGNGETEFKPALHATIITVKGISSNWRQPVGYFFVNTPCPAGKLQTIIGEMILRLTSIGLNVKGVTSGMGSNNLLFTKTLGVSPELPYFHHDNKKIHYLFDVPRLLKSIRNNLLKYDFKIDGGIISWKFIESFYRSDQTYPEKAAPELTDAHINPNRVEKMEIKLATQIFSNAVVAGLNLYIRFDKLPPEARETQQFVQRMCTLFDLLNASDNSGTSWCYSGYTGSDDQKKFLEDCYKFFDNIVVLDGKEEDVTKGIKCIDCWKTTIKGIMQLWDDVSDQGMRSLYAGRLHLECFDNAFGYVKQTSGNCINPTPIKFVRSYRELFSVRTLHSGIDNCEENTAKLMLSIADLPQNQFSDDTGGESQLQEGNVDVEYRNSETLQRNFFKHISGYLLKKCLGEHGCSLCQAYTKEVPTELGDSEVRAHFRGSNRKEEDLQTPRDTFVDFISSLEAVFQRHFECLSVKDGVVSELVKLFQTVKFDHPCPNFPNDFLLKLFAKIRIFYTLRDINRNFNSAKRHQKKIIWERC